MRVVNMEHKVKAKGDASIHHEIKEKTSLAKRTDSGISSAARTLNKEKSEKQNPVNHRRRMTSMPAGLRMKSVKPGGLNRIIMQKSGLKKAKTKRLLKKLKLAKIGRFKGRKFRIKYKPKFGKLKAASAAVNKYAVKPVSAGVKKTAAAAGSAVGKALDSSDNETVQFAKKSYDGAKTAARTVKNTVKNTVKGTRKLAKTVDRGVRNVRRNIKYVKHAAKTAQKAAKATARAAKSAAKITSKTVQAIAKAAVQAVHGVVSFIASTAPWSLIIIAAVLLIVIIVYMLMNVITAIAGGQRGAGGWAMGESDTESDVYANFSELGELLDDACDSSFADSLKSTIKDFCALWYHEDGCQTAVDDDGNSYKYCDGHIKDNVLEVQINGSSVYYQAHGHDDEANGKIDAFIGGASGISSKNYSDFMAALVVLKTRENKDNENFALEKFTKADMEKFIGGVNSNTCDYGDTFFIKTTERTTGKCPNENCRTEYKGDDCCSRVNSNGDVVNYCGGHPYCPGTHDKLIVKLKTVDEYYEKSIAEIYGFDDEEREQFEAVREFVSAILEDFAGT